MSTLRKITLTLVVLCMVAITVPSVAVAADIDEPDSWGEEVFNYSKTPPTDADPPGDLEAAFISYDGSDDTVQFRINFTNEAPQNPMSDNITQIYIDSDLDSKTGLNNETYTDGSDAEKFYNNTDNIGADYRVSIGAGTDLVAPWDEGATQFIGGESESIDVENRNNSVIANVPQSAIDDSDTFDLKFVYLDTSDEVEGVEDYTWAPDADDEEINSTRFSTESDTVVPQATIEAVINISDDAVDEDATVDFTLNDDSGDTTQREGSVEGNNNITETFTVDARDFAEGDGTLRAEIDGENYTLDAEKEIPSIEENDVESKVFDPHGLIDISGNVSGLSNTKGGEVTISVNKTENNEATVADQTIEFDGESDEKPYRFTLNATNFTDGGVVEAELDAGLNTISADSNTNFQTSRYNPTNKTQGFTVNDVGQTLSLETNLSEVDVFTDNGFNITVTASSDGTNGEEINTVRHRIEYDTDNLSVSNIEYLVSSEVKNITSESYGHEILVTDPTPLVDSGSENLYNITFKLNETVDPNQGANVNVTPTTRDDTRLFNSSSNDRELEFDKSAETVTVTNSETRIQNSDLNVNSLTVGGNMVGSPTKFDIEATSVNDGELANIILYNERTGSVSGTIDCDSKSECSGTLSDTPSSSTYLGNSSGYGIEQRYNITAYPSSAGDPVVTNESVTVYKEADVNGDGVVGVEDIKHIVNNRDQEAEGGLPWDNDAAAARSDVNNDGDVDIVDITIVTEKY